MGTGTSGLKLALVTLACLCVASAGAAQETSLSPAQDPLAGAQVFGAKGCVKCHAVRGIGGTVGPDLARMQRSRTFYDLATAMWNHLPRMIERMQELGIPRPVLDARETGDLIGFLYTLNYFDPGGNPAAGSRLFGDKRCIMCHQVAGTGGVVGPNLDFIKAFGSPIFVAAALWNHGPAMMKRMRERGIERPAFTASELRDLVAFLTPTTTAALEGPVYVLPGRAAEGQTLFAVKRCVECHSIGGRGGQGGPDLLNRDARMTLMDFAAKIWNKAPAMLASMRPRDIPPPQLRPDEMADIVAYLYSVRYFAEAGNVRKGWTVAANKGCLGCHAVSGERGKPASDLTRVRGLDSPPAVMAALWNHAMVSPVSATATRAAWPEFRPDEMADLVALMELFGRGR